MKFSIRQILASTAGAVCAAIIASLFGVKGTIVGVAIGSAAATMATAFVAQSIDRGHQVVKQVAVRAPESSSLLRRLGGTRASGAVGILGGCRRILGPHRGGRPVGAEGAQCARHDRNGIDGGPGGDRAAGDLGVRRDSGHPARGGHHDAMTTPVRQAPARRAAPQGFSWRAIAGTVAIVFVLALLFITAIELISGKPLSAIFGGADTGTTLKNLVNPSPAPPAAPTSTTSTTSTTGASTSTTTTSAATTTTSTTAPNGSATTTPTSSTASTTTTTGPALSASTTTTSTSAP